MSCLPLQIAWQVDNVDGIKRTFLCIGNLSGVRHNNQTTFTHIPQPIHSDSDMVAILSCGVTSMQSFPAADRFHDCFSQTISCHIPILLTGQDLRHSCRHFLGLHRSTLTMATRVSFSSPLFLERDIIINNRGGARTWSEGA